LDREEESSTAAHLSRRHAPLQEKRQIFREQHGLIDNDLSTGDPEFAVGAPEYERFLLVHVPPGRLYRLG
jgi:hypothetical protein